VKPTPAASALILTLSVGCSGEHHAPTAALADSTGSRANAAPTLGSAQPTVVEPRPAPSQVSRCNEQVPQEFLQRAHLNYAAKSRAERAAMLKLRNAAIEYRTAQYGYFEGFGSHSANARSPAQQSKSTSFFGLPVVMHERVIFALECVEEQLKRDCSAFDYKPRHLSGLRTKNTYIDGEVSNHIYGIAIDIDPLKNPCCKCLEPWSSSERCRGNKTVWQRMAMPECWVQTFERFGFYWLGHDVLEDTMHFEFLGDPERIRRSPEEKPPTVP
jgi:hypothetical protein